MKKYLMTLAAVLCCAMTTVVFTACSSNEDNPTFPSIDVNNGVVINLGSIVIKPYLQFGASLADVEAYMKANYPDWTDNNPDALNEYQQQGGRPGRKPTQRTTEPSSTFSETPPVAVCFLFPTVSIRPFHFQQ